MQRLRELLTALRAATAAERRRLRRHAKFERYYLRRELKAHRAELAKWDADCARLEELPTKEVSR